MTVIGYARVSTTDQNLEIQQAALRRPAAMSSAQRSAAVLPQRGGPNCKPCWTSCGRGTF